MCLQSRTQSAEWQGSRLFRHQASELHQTGWYGGWGAPAPFRPVILHRTACARKPRSRVRRRFAAIIGLICRQIYNDLAENWLKMAANILLTSMRETAYTVLKRCLHRRGKRLTSMANATKAYFRKTWPACPSAAERFGIHALLHVRHGRSVGKLFRKPRKSRKKYAPIPNFATLPRIF